MGIEPLSTLVNGFDERISKGILPLPLMFHSTPGSAYEGFRPPTAEWIIKASEKMTNSFMKHIFKWFKPAKSDKNEGGRQLSRFSPSRMPTTHLSVVFDEIGFRINKLLNGRSIKEFLEGRKKK